MEIMKQGRADRDHYRNRLRELRISLKQAQTHNLNFFKRLEEDSKEQEQMRK